MVSAQTGKETCTLTHKYIFICVCVSVCVWVCVYILPLSGISCHVVWYKFTNVSQKTTATIFWAEKYDFFFLSININKLFAHYTAQYHISEDLYHHFYRNLKSQIKPTIVFSILFAFNSVNNLLHSWEGHPLLLMFVCVCVCVMHRPLPDNTQHSLLCLWHDFNPQSQHVISHRSTL